MSREALEAAAHDCLTALAGVETHDIDLRDHPQAWQAIEAFAAAAQADAFERAARECNRLSVALDNAGNMYLREATASQCADAIRAQEIEMRNNDCSAGPLDVDVRAQATGNLAAALTKQLDNTIAAEITNRLGNGWSLESLAGRLERKVFQSGIEVLALDGQDMLELHPVRFEQSTEGGSIKIKAVQDYRVLRPNAEVSGAGTASAGLPGYAAGGNGERK